MKNAQFENFYYIKSPFLGNIQRNANIAGPYAFPPYA
jgi:hypothetical protein